jgi:[ribosomal protein S18]-alanine N-acetyltransferase
VAEGLVLRAVTPEDDDELVGWFDDAAALRRFAGPTLRWPLTTEQLRAVRADTHAWTAWTDGRRVGRAELVDICDGGLRLVRVAVAPGERGRGFGTALLRALLEQADALAATRVELNVLVDNDVAQRLYRSAGFEPVTEASGVLRMARDV